jgi:Mn-dependent DtxR family transcriptional regulator
MPTPSMEDLTVHPSSVTKMVQKLDKDDYLVYEKYRGLVLTPKGNKVGKRLVYRHELLEQFLRVIGVKEEHIYEDVEGIEHHLSWDSIDRIGDLVQFFEEEKKRLEDLRDVQSRSE